MSAIASKRTRVENRVVSSREVALQVVRDVFGDHPRGARESLDYRTRAANTSPRDRAFATELAYGSIKMRRWLDYQLAPYLGERAATLPKAIGEILRLGVYQLRVMNGVEAYAAVSECVGLARRYGHKGTAGLVNAVLRKVSTDPVREAPGDDDDAVALRASLPTWIVTQWHERFGADALPLILAGVNAPAAIGLCVDFRRGSRDEALAILRGANIPAEASAFARDAIVLDGTSPSTGVDALADGRWDMHAEAACFPVDLLDPQPHEIIYEGCSGRGNKTLQIAGRTGDTGRINAVDIESRRVTVAQERMDNAHVTSAMLAVADATVASGDADCDRVLVDAPCSGLGIVGRQPEARWRKDRGDGERLAPVQAAILAAAAQRLKSGGTLVYS
ncbi:MAG TPA: transcription antitermination factor NusB, partial [Caballeronia sp.]|nr:transcription antitermination factor NusB [Caballeronia sp.]